MGEETETKSSSDIATAPAEPIVETETHQLEEDVEEKKKKPETVIIEEKKIEAVSIEVKKTETATIEEKTVTSSPSFVEESYYVKDLKDSEKKALGELKAKIQEAISANTFLVPPKPPTAVVVVEEEKKEVIVEETKEEATAVSTEAVKENEEDVAREESKQEAPAKDETTATSGTTEVTETTAAQEEVAIIATEKGEVVVEGGEEEEEEDDGSPSLEELDLWGVPLLHSKGDERTDVVLLKFLRARDFKVSEALSMLKGTLAWRREFFKEEEKSEEEKGRGRGEEKEAEAGNEGEEKKKEGGGEGEEEVEEKKEEAEGEGVEEEKKKKNGEEGEGEEEEEEEGARFGSVAYMQGFDREGHPVCYNNYEVFQDEELYQKTFGEEARFRKFLRWRIGVVEEGIKSLDFRPGGVHSILQVLDLHGSPGFIKRRNISKRAFSILQDNYPELVAKQIFINVPWYFGVLISLHGKLITPRTKSKYVYATPDKATETLFKYISPDNVPVKYGGFNRPNDTEFVGVEAPVKEITLKVGEQQTIEIPVEETGSTVVWDVSVVGWDVVYGEEFVPSREDAYTIIIRKPKKLTPSEEPIRNSFKAFEPGKVVLTIDNNSRKKKLAVYRHVVIKKDEEALTVY